MSPAPTYHLNIAELIATAEPAVISTVLGSCVSVCVFAKNGGAGGMIHYALPHAPGDCADADAYRYGDRAIPALIAELGKLLSRKPGDWVAKIVGGAGEVGGGPTGYPVGEENVAIARRLLARHGIAIVGEAVGGDLGRKVLFHVPGGRLQVAPLRKQPEAPNPAKLAAIGRAPAAAAPTTAPTPVAGSSRVSAAPRPPRKVLIVDDSKTIRDLLFRILSEDPELRVVGRAADAFEAAELVLRERPDVVTLDIHMPKMTGVEWLEQLLPKNPLPVVMISSLQLQEGNEVFRALELGAVDYVQKPTLSELPVVGPAIREKVKAAATAKVFKNKTPTRVLSLPGTLDARKILAIGASTGGTEALKSVLCSLPSEIPPTVIVQHIPPVFSKAFADRLNELCEFEVKEAEDGDELRPSRVLIAPGGRQMKLEKTATGYRVRVNDDPPMNRHKPSVDYLFDSVSTLVGSRAVGVILTGMGGDGARGLLEMRKQGAATIGQDEASCVVYGMPKVAFEVGAVEKVASLADIPRLILQRLERKAAA